MSDRADLAGAVTLGRRTALVAIASRVAVFAATLTGAVAAHGSSGWVQGALRDLLITPWTRKDAAWFVRIAEQGYGPRMARAAFFPLYPVLIRAVSVLTLGSYWAAGIVVSLACYAAAMLLLYRLTTAEAAPRTAADTVLLISVFPTAFVFSAVYSESLFLLLTVAVFFLAQRRRWALACAAGFLAALTRNSGVILMVPLLLLYAEQRGWTSRRPTLAWPRDAGVAWLLLVPAGLAVYMAYLWARFGDALLFAHVQGANWDRTLSWPWIDAWRGARAAYTGLAVMARDRSSLFPGLLPGHRLEFVLAWGPLPFTALVFAAFCLVLVFRRLPLAYGVYSLLMVAFPLFEPSGTKPLLSYHRFVLVIFPLFMGLALVLQRRRILLWIVVTLSFILMLYLTVCFTSGIVKAHGVV